MVPATTSPMPKLVSESLLEITQNSKITMSAFRCVFVPSIGAVRAIYIYISLAPSHCGYYGGFNTSFGNASCFSNVGFDGLPTVYTTGLVTVQGIY